MLIRFARSVEVAIGVTVSVGLSYCKFLAKLASDLNKPRGFALLSREEAKAWLATQSVERLWGIGRVGVWSRHLLGHSYRVIRRMRYGPGSSWERHDDRGGPSSDTA
jgi:nucleotidyltransferase/DNA polymerase involved in DNA repair